MCAVLMRSIAAISGAPDGPAKTNLMKKLTTQLEAANLRTPTRQMMEDVNVQLAERDRQKHEAERLRIEREQQEHQSRLDMDRAKLAGTTSRVWLTLLLVLGLVGLLMVVGVALPQSAREFIRVNILRQPVYPRQPLIMYNLKEKLTTEGCVYVQPDHIQQGKFFDKYLYDDVRTSMLWHMLSHNYSGITAQHVGLPFCYVILDTKRFDYEGQEFHVNLTERTLQSYERDVDYLEMFNMDLVGYSGDDLMAVQEANAFCPTVEWRTRYLQVVATYLKPGKDRPRKFRDFFNSTHSYNLQHFFEVHHGLSGCNDDTVNILRHRIFNPNNPGSKMGRVMILDHPESHRSRIAAPPSAEPVPQLPRLPSSNNKVPTLPSPDNNNNKPPVPSPP